WTASKATLGLIQVLACAGAPAPPDRHDPRAFLTVDAIGPKDSMQYFARFLSDGEPLGLNLTLGIYQNLESTIDHAFHVKWHRLIFLVRCKRGSFHALCMDGVSRGARLKPHERKDACLAGFDFYHPKKWAPPFFFGEVAPNTFLETQPPVPPPHLSCLQ